MKNILITGGAGFIGSYFITYYLQKHENCRIINLDSLSYAANLDNLSSLSSLSSDNRHIFVKGDICNRGLVEYLFKKYDIRQVIHFAAESHVDNSITNPSIFIQTNIMGTFTLLDVAYKHWMLSPNKYKAGYSNSSFHHVSTDEVYGSLGKVGLFSESSPYLPNSPYSASKASSDMITRSYFHTYGLKITITNCSNNYGPHQHEEKLIPTIIRNALLGKKIPIYGDGENIRDWLYVEDHCTGIDLVLDKGKGGEVYNIGGNNEKTNNDIALIICNLLDEHKPKVNGKRYHEQITYVEDRPGHDLRYAIDPSKIQLELNWSPEENFETGIIKTVLWYLEYNSYD